PCTLKAGCAIRLHVYRCTGRKTNRQLREKSRRRYQQRSRAMTRRAALTRQRRRRPENALQRPIVEHYRQRAAPGVFMFAVPNGGFRRPVEAAILKATGTVAGIPDTIWIKDGQVYALELKAPGGRLTPAQEGVLVALREAGATATHAHGLDQALQILERWQLLRGRAQ